MAKTNKKKKAWEAMSKYIRSRDKNICFTCGQYGNQAGHLFPKALGNALYFEESNVHCQCYRCNINLGGNGAVYSEKFIKLYGKKEFDRLYKLIGTIKIYREEDYERIRQEYKDKLKKLINKTL